MTRSKSLKTLLTVATSVAMSSCGLADIVEQVQAQIEALNIDPASLQKLLAQSSKSFSVAGEQVSGNMEQIAGGGQRAGSEPTLAPSFDAKAEGETCETVSKTDGEDGTKTAIIDFSTCTDRKGQIKVVIEKDEKDIISTMTYTGYSENAEDATNYVYYDGDMKWTMKVEAGAMSVASNNAYNTKYALEDGLAELYMTESLDLTYSDGGLVIDGTNTITEGDKTAILSFTSVTFDPATCPKGPSSGKINLKIGGDFVEITITACAEAIQKVSKDGTETSTDMTGADLEAFFKEFAANLNTFDQQMASTAGKVGGVGAIADCLTTVANANLSQYAGIWCQAFPASDTNAYLWCQQICDVGEAKEFPNYFRLEGVATWSGNFDADAPYGYIEPSAVEPVCLDRSYIVETGLLKYGEQVDTGSILLDIVNVQPDMNFGYEGDMMEPSEPMPMAPGDPGEEFFFPVAWNLSNGSINEYSAMSLMQSGVYDFTQEFLVGSFGQLNATVADCTPTQIEEVLFSADIGGAEDYCADPANAADPACNPDSYCMDNPQAPECGGMDFCADPMNAELPECQGDSGHPCDPMSMYYNEMECSDICLYNPADSWCQ